MSSNIRTTIHNYWESFVPSALYLGTFVIVWISLLGGRNALSMLNAPRVIGILRRSDLSQVLRELELMKLVPFAVVLLVAIVLYLCDQFVSFVGWRLPPHVIWRGSPVLYWSEYVRQELWMLLPTVSNPMALDFEAGVVIDQAIAEGNGLAVKSRYQRDNHDKAIRTTNFAKTGLLWVVICFVWALVLHQPAWRLLLLSLVFAAFYAGIGVASIVRQRYWFIAESEADGRLAMKILYSRNVRPSKAPERREDLNRAFENSINYSKRMVSLSWGSLDNYRRMYRTFFGYLQPNNHAKPGL